MNLVFSSKDVRFTDLKKTLYVERLNKILREKSNLFNTGFLKYLRRTRRQSTLWKMSFFQLPPLNFTVTYFYIFFNMKPTDTFKEAQVFLPLRIQKFLLVNKIWKLKFYSRFRYLFHYNLKKLLQNSLALFKTRWWSKLNSV